MLKFAAEYLPEAATITSPQFRECFGEAQDVSALVPALESLPVGEIKYVAAGFGSAQRYSTATSIECFIASPSGEGVPRESSP
jgi:hypothetical protein